jgi:transposase
MITKITQEMVLRLYSDGKSQREISRLLKLSRQTVHKVISATKKGCSASDANKNHINLPEFMTLIKMLYRRCEGNVVRIKEILGDEYNKTVAYSTLTDWIRKYHVKEQPKRAGSYYFAPGEEMQHDTSPHQILIGEKKIKAQCASLIFAYSRKLYMQYYPCFTRFEAQAFLTSALQFMRGSCKQCVIDNTSVILKYGSGADAIMCQQMETFARIYGFVFKAHAIGHADRKAHVERFFYYIERNFIPGRTFKNWNDLNTQAEQWCVQVANAKEKRSLGMSPNAAFVQEAAYLNALPRVLPPIYEHYERIVDHSAFINLECNRYSVPEKHIGQSVHIYKYPQEIKIFYKNTEIASHLRIIGEKEKRSIIKEHHQQVNTQRNRRIACDAEYHLKGEHELLDTYINALKNNVRGRGQRTFERLLSLKRTYPKEAFLNAISQAHKYHLYDLSRVERLIIQYASGNYFNLTLEDSDE